MKSCKTCGKEEAEVEFTVRGTNMKGENTYRPFCKSCWKLEQKKQYQKHKEKRLEKQRLYCDNNPDYPYSGIIKRKYGITIEDYYSMLLSQKDSCAICKTHKDKFKKKLSIDHSHKTGKVRGILCESCNRGLGLLKDRIDILESAIKYLRENEAI